MGGVASYRELVAWQQAMELAVACYRVTNTLPASERFGLASQLRRAATSVPSNIAEGNGHRHRGDYLRYLEHARGSLSEVETQLHLVMRLGFATADAVEPVLDQAARVGRILLGLHRAIRASAPLA